MKKYAIIKSKKHTKNLQKNPNMHITSREVNMLSFKNSCHQKTTDIIIE